MVVITVSALTLGLAALSSALPAAEPRALSRREFTLRLELGKGVNSPPRVLQPDTLGTLNLIFDHNSSCPTTHAYLANTNLEFDASHVPKVDSFQAPSASGAKNCPFDTVLDSPGDNVGYSIATMAIFEDAGATKDFSFSKASVLQAPRTGRCRAR